MMMMVEVYTAESNGRDIRRCSMIGSRWVCLTIIDQYGRVTSDNVMTRERWVRSNHIGRYILKATARDTRRHIEQDSTILFKKEKMIRSILQRSVLGSVLGEKAGEELWQ